MALHPADRQVRSLAGIARIIRSPAAYDRLFEAVPSEANAMTFCQGCFAQMLDAEGVYAAIRHFGSLRKIAFVHFRNVTGGPERFDETYWDEGKVDNVRAIRGYRDAGYDGYLVPDHAPRGVGDTDWGHRARAFAIGYLRGLLQSAET
jgi:mannonate dehydratase